MNAQVTSQPAPTQAPTQPNQAPTTNIAPPSPPATSAPSIPPANSGAESKPVPKLDPKLEQWIKRDREIAEKQKTITTQKTELEVRQKEIEAHLNKLKEFETLKASDPVKALQLLGIDAKALYNPLTDAILKESQDSADGQVKALEQKVDQLIKGQEQLYTSQQEQQLAAQQKEEQRIIGEFKQEITDYIKGNIGRYEFIDYEKAHELVYHLIDNHYEQTKDPETGIGKVLTISEAADKVEQLLEEKYHKVQGLKKFQGFLSARGRVNNLDKQIPNQRQQPKTLTNQLSASPMPTPPEPTGYLTDEQRVARAIAYARGLRS